MGAHGIQLDRVAGQLDVEGFGLALAHHGDLDFRTDRAAHQIDRLVEREPEHAFAIHMGDIVAGLDSGFGRRGAVHGRDHLDEALFLRDLDAEPAEFALGLHLHRVGILG